MSFFRTLFSRFSKPQTKPDLLPWQIEVLDRFDAFLAEEARRHLAIDIAKRQSLKDGISTEIDKIIAGSITASLIPAETTLFSGCDVDHAEPITKISGTKADVFILDDIEKAPARKRSETIKGKRFRRSKEEIALGLTPEQAILRRQKSTPTLRTSSVTVRVKPVSVPIDRPAGPSVVDELVDTLREPLRSRTQLVMERRRNGDDSPFKTADLDAEIARRLASGQVTKLPAGVDSTGYQHFPA